MPMLTLTAQNNPQQTDMELVVQIQNNFEIEAEMKNLTPAKAYGIPLCTFYSESSYTSTVEFDGSYFGTKLGFQICEEGEYKSYQMKHALNIIKFKFDGNYVQDESGVDLYFKYDTRDCNYYSGCENDFVHDVTIRLVYDGYYYKIWFFNGYETSPEIPTSSNGWTDVSQSTIHAWDAAGYTHCDIYWETEAPTIPQGFYISGNAGQSPILHWNNNEEPDLAGYKIYQSIDGVPYSLLTSVSSTTTSFTNNGVTISGGYFDPFACYKISAYDDGGLESEKTLPECVKFNELSKENVGETINSKLFNNTLYEVYPNPFNPATNIKYELAEDGDVYLAIYDILGKEVKILINEFKGKGVHVARLDASNLSAGFYLYTMKVNGFLSAKKILLLK